MRVLIWMVVAALLVLVFAGDGVRDYFAGDTGKVARANEDDRKNRAKDSSSVSKAQQSEPSAPSGAYVPSPADAPELYDSPTRRFGL